MSYIGNKPADTIASSSDIADGAITAAKLASASVTQPKINGGVAGTGPAFSAYQSSAQTLSSNTFTKIQLQTEEYDTANAFDNTTNYRFTPNVAGYYQVVGCIAVGAVVSGINLAIYKNGSVYKSVFSSASSTVSIGSGTIQMYFNGSTDYIELYASIGVGQVLANSSQYTYFQATMIRTA